MENRINTKASNHIRDVKSDMLELINSVKKGIEEETLKNDDTVLDELIKHVNSIKPMVLSKEDFMKRKRSKNSVCLSDRCMAKRANGEQCSRRKKENCNFCGTHIKGVPHGVITTETSEVLTQKEVWCEDIGGIIQYIDTDGNVYSHEDVIKNVVNPSVIAKYEIRDEKYYIVN